MLSVIICTLNEEHYLPKLLDTLFIQKCPHFEVIIVDAGSDDGTAAVIEEYKSKGNQIRFIQLTRPGLSAQRNIGVENAFYDQLLFLDADVLLPNDFIKNSMDQIVKDNIRIAGTKIYAAESSLFYRLMYWNYSAFYLPVVRLFNPIIHGCSIFVTRELHYKIGGFKKDVTFEDFRYAADARPFFRPRLLNGVYVKTSARRYYKFSFREWAELFASGIYSIFKAGIDGKKFMKKFHENYGKHQKPKY